MNTNIGLKSVAAKAATATMVPTPLITTSKPYRCWLIKELLLQPDKNKLLLAQQENGIDATSQPNDATHSSRHSTVVATLSS